MALAMNRFVKRAALILLPIVFLDLWYVVATDYDYTALAGTYVLDQNGDKCILHLRTDRTFTEELNHAGAAQKVEGTWRRIGEAGVSFSKEFLSVGEDRSASGEAYGSFDKEFGLLTTLTLAPQFSAPILRKKLFD